MFDILNVECKIGDIVFKATGSKMKFDGYTKVYNFSEREDKILPSIEKGYIKYRKYIARPTFYTTTSKIYRS